MVLAKSNLAPMTARDASSSLLSNDGEFAQVLPGVNQQNHATVAEIAAWCLTGMSGWWSLNIITAELPYFVAELPQGQRLGNLIAVCTQLGNVAPILYRAVFRHQHGARQLVCVIAAFQCLATATLVVCAILWQSTAALLVCTALAGSVGCLSNVTYWAAAAARPPSCVRAMSVGMTFGGLLATAFSAIQMAGRKRGDPRFAPHTFFLLAAVIQVSQLIAFLYRSYYEGLANREAEENLEPGSRSRSSCAEAAAAALPLPTAAKLLVASCGFIYAATYTVPSLQPFLAGAFSDPTDRQQLLLWMLAIQNAGDVLGRLATIFVSSKVVALLPWAVLLIASFAFAVFGSAYPDAISSLTYEVALYALPAMCGVFYFSRGLLVTSLYLSAQQMGEKALVQRISINMGFVGQMGALAANIITFILLSSPL